MVQPLWKVIRQFLQKLNIELPNDSAFLLLGMHYPNELKAGTQMGICTPMFATAKRWKQLKCLSGDEKINKRWYIRTTEYNSAVKGNDTVTWMNLENIMLSK